MHSFLQFLRDDNPGSSEDLLNFVISDDLKYELGMLLSSRPLYHETDDLPFVNSSVLNYGITASVYGVSASEHSDSVNSEISSRILITLQRYESRLGNPVVEHLFSDDNYSFFSVTALFFMDRVKFCIKWDKHSGEFSLYE
ncbi:MULTISPECIES: lysozyme family protein [Escherichia]|uniref:Lysozyme family protein n=1 Tax=Escherichia coli TaxID=562 RepID=A0A2A6Q1L0_ECOLX|nr:MULTISPECIES: lysozyme family protein [Escherichia]EKY5862305.1 lysozyme family protein [Escherichia coli O157]EEW8434422.1 lysozyme family protein [Escherichia coli]EEY1461131.1 lysozyme family protein [Escherichia coli]EEY3225210.1 lysozyme family protein [Escherichia coli]EFF8446772.1 lysozyme family protein [Escherichia coli]